MKFIIAIGLVLQFASAAEAGISSLKSRVWIAFEGCDAVKS